MAVVPVIWADPGEGEVFQEAGEVVTRQDEGLGQAEDGEALLVAATVVAHQGHRPWKSARF
jgi:hypothetical protein